MPRYLSTCVVLLGLVGLVPQSAFAQDRGGDVAGTYTFRHLASGGEGFNMPLGFSFSVAGRMSPVVSVVGEIVDNYRSANNGLVSGSVNYVTFAGGVRFSQQQMKTPKTARPFAEILVGVSHLSAGITGLGSASATAFHIGPKGGVDVPLGGAAFLRAAAGFELEHGGDWAHAFRFDVGVGVPFGKK